MRLTRSRDDVIMSGVLAGIAEYFILDPTLIRIGFVVLSFLGGGGFLIPLYIAGAIIIPRAPREDRRKRQFNRRNPREQRRFERSNRQDYERPKTERDPNRKTNEIDEDDWSDF